MNRLRRTKAKRKLINRKVLSQIYGRDILGVPLAKIVKQLDLDITPKAMSTLLYWYKETIEAHPETAKVILDSLFPIWLDEESNLVQENPEGWVYIGRFPLGYWDCDAND